MSIRRTFLLLIVTALLLASAAPAQSQDASPQAVVLVLSTPAVDMDPRNIGDLERLAANAARPLLEQLEQMQADGQVAGYEMLPGSNAVLVTYDPSILSLADLQSLPGVADTRDPARSTLSCPEQGFKQLYKFSQQISSLSATPVVASATNPSINVFISSIDSFNVTGYTGAGIPVTMVIRNSAGVEKLRYTTNSYSDGWYYYYSGYTSCGAKSTKLTVGDIVEVTANGNTVQLVIVPLSGIINGTADTISGVTAPNRTVEVTLYNVSASSSCTLTQDFSATSDGAGAFIFNGIGSLDNSTDGEISVKDANSNVLSTVLTNYYLELGRTGSFQGNLPPNAPFTAILKRGGTTLSTVEGQAGSDGIYYGYLNSMAPGDVITLTSGALTFSIKFATVTNMVFDTANNRITGQVGSAYAGYVVYTYLRRERDYSCNSAGGCGKGVVAANGSFTIDFGSFDMIPSDSDTYPILYDPQGNRIRFRDDVTVPYLFYNASSHYLNGYWRNTDVPLTITIKDSVGTVKSTLNRTSDSGDGYFYAYPSAVAGDRIEVSDGATTMTINPIPNIDAFLDSTNNTIHGAAPNGTASLRVYDKRYYANPDGYVDDIGSAYSYSYYCASIPVTTGAYTVAPPNMELNGPDNAYLYSTINDGNIIGAYSHAFNVISQKGNPYITGYFPKGGGPFTAELWRGGVKINTQSGTSSSDGYFDFSFTSPAQDGDIMKVTAPGVVTGQMTLPILTMQQNNATGTVSGVGPASTELMVNAFQPEPSYEYFFERTTTDASGNYSVTIDDWFDDNCQLLKLGNCNRPEVIYQTHEILTYFVSGVIPPVTSDSFEADNSFTTARPYTGIQSHTFHTMEDQDWVKVVVTAQDVGKTFYLSTTLLGVNASTNLYLYDSSGITEIMSETDYEPKASRLTWTPASAGTYYVKIEPYSTSYTVRCGSTYKFFIARSQVFLPTLSK